VRLAAQALQFYRLAGFGGDEGETIKSALGLPWTTPADGPVLGSPGAVAAAVREVRRPS
jgi:hypothetical protein